MESWENLKMKRWQRWRGDVVAFGGIREAKDSEKVLQKLPDSPSGSTEAVGGVGGAQHAHKDYGKVGEGSMGVGGDAFVFVEV